MKFPSVKATSLTNKPYQLPRDLEGELNLVIVAFKQWQQDWVDTWIPSLQSLAYQHKNLRVYEMPTMSRFNGIYRFMIDNGMRAGIPDKAVRAATLCAYIDIPPFAAGAATAELRFDLSVPARSHGRNPVARAGRI